MARPSKAEQSETKLTDLDFTELLKDTDFKMAATGSVMHSRIKIRTPLEVLNCIYGGGLPLGIISEVSGSPGSGKSTFLYQCMATYQKDYPKGVPVIFDMETSMDNGRLRSLGVDTEKVLRLPSTTKQSAFANMFKILNKLEKVIETNPDISTFMIYDSLDGGGTDKQQEAAKKGESVFGAGTMMEDARIIKAELKNLLPYMEKFPVFLALINQVYTHTDRYGNSSVKAGGAMGLKHFDHCHIEFGSPKDEEDGDFIIGTSSTVQLKKSKLSPKITNIQCYIDVTKGGLIDEEKSFAKYLCNKSVGFVDVGTWSCFSDKLKMQLANNYPQLKDNAEFLALIAKKFRQDDLGDILRDNLNFYLLMRIALIDFLDNIYPAQREVNSEYQEQLIKRCEYLV